MSASNDSPIKTLLLLAATAFFAVAIRGWYEGTFKKTRPYGFFAVGLLLFFGAFFWTAISPVLGQKFTQSAQAFASDFRSWAVLLALIWIYAAIQSVLTTIQRDKYADIIKEDINPFRLALQKWVIPRSLTPDQIVIISKHLSSLEKSVVHFRIKAYDREADQFASDIQTALREGGWTVGTVLADNDGTDPVPEGLHIHHSEDHQTALSRRTSAPHISLALAFRLAGIELDSAGGGGAAAPHPYMVTVRVGARRRDPRGTAQKWIVPK